MDYSLCATAAPRHPVTVPLREAHGRAVVLSWSVCSRIFSSHLKSWFSALAAHWTQQCLGPSGPAGQNRRGRGPGNCIGQLFESSQQMIFQAPLAFTCYRN